MLFAHSLPVLSSDASVVRADPTRLAAQIVTGVGFLGAGRSSGRVVGRRPDHPCDAVGGGSDRDEVERVGARLHAIEVSQEGDRPRLRLDVALPAGTKVPVLVARVADVAHVDEVRWD